APPPQEDTEKAAAAVQPYVRHRVPKRNQDVIDLCVSSDEEEAPPPQEDAKKAAVVPAREMSQAAAKGVALRATASDDNFGAYSTASGARRAALSTALPESNGNEDDDPYRVKGLDREQLENIDSSMESCEAEKMAKSTNAEERFKGRRWKAALQQRYKIMDDFLLEEAALQRQAANRMVEEAV
ncbi:MAG: hypothetical protein SGARI_001800, partial [Bacillariaceae sp.]